MMAYRVFQVHRARLAAVAEMQNKLAHIAREEAHDTEQLMVGVPTKLRGHLARANILRSLFERGDAELTLVYAGAPLSSVGNVNTTHELLEKLQARWTGNIDIKLEEQGDRVRVLFRATSAPL